MTEVISNVERQNRLLRYIEQKQRVTVPQLCEQFEISLATARRDLDSLAEQGKVQRVHGGAIAVRQAPPEPPALQRAAEQADEKKRIAVMTAGLIEDGEAVFLSSGTTVAEIAVHLRGRRLTVVTNSLLVINALADSPEINLIALGGILRRSEMSLIGHIAEQSLAEVRTNKVIIGIRAMDVEHGLTNDYIQETMTDRAILKIGQEVVVVADHTKCGRVSTAFVAPITAIHTLVTDTETSQNFVAALSEKGIRVITA